MKIYVLRHGRTVWNEKGITQGQSQNRLSKTGKEQVEETAKKFQNIDFDIIYCSPLMRTVQTANIFNKYHHKRIIKDDRLIEIGQGIFTGRKFSSLTEEEKLMKLNRDSACGMKSIDSLYVRTKNFVDEIINTCPYSAILIVTHSRNAAFIDDILTDKEVDMSVDSSTFANAELREYNV